MKNLLCVICLAHAIAVLATAQAQGDQTEVDATVSALTSQLQILELQRQIAEANQKIAAAEKAIASDESPTIAATGRGPIEGKVDLLSSQAVYPATFVVYKSITQLGREVATAVGALLQQPLSSLLGSNPKAVVIVTSDNTLVAAVAEVEVLSRAVSLYQQQMAALEKELADASGSAGAQPGGGAGLGLAAANAALSGLSNIAGFFGSNYGLAAANVTPDERALLVSVAGTLATNEALAIRTWDDTLALGSSSAILRELGESFQSSLRSKGLVNSLAGVLAQQGNNADAKLKSLVERAKSILANYDTFHGSITSKGTNGAPAPAERAIALQSRLPICPATTPTFILTLDTVSAGGSQVIRQSRFAPARTDFLGGASAAYVLIEVCKNNVLGAGMLDNLTNGGFALRKLRKGQPLLTVAPRTQRSRTQRP
jgi:hypothetical protein